MKSSDENIVFFLGHLLAELCEGTMYNNHEDFCGFTDSIADRLNDSEYGIQDSTLVEIRDMFNSEIMNGGYFARYAQRHGITEWTLESSEKARKERVENGMA